METNSTYFWDGELRAGSAGTWDGTPELLDTCFANVPPDIREIRLRADSGFGFDPVLQALEKASVDYVVVARMTKGVKRLLPGLQYEPVNRQWQMAEFEYRPHGRMPAASAWREGSSPMIQPIHSFRSGVTSIACG